MASNINHAFVSVPPSTESWTHTWPRPGTIKGGSHLLSDRAFGQLRSIISWSPIGTNRESLFLLCVSMGLMMRESCYPIIVIQKVTDYSYQTLLPLLYIRAWRLDT